jgi:hypothetical protein
MPEIHFETDAEFKDSLARLGLKRKGCAAFTLSEVHHYPGTKDAIFLRITQCKTASQLLALLAHELAHWVAARIDHQPDWDQHFIGSSWHRRITQIYAAFDNVLLEKGGGLFPRTMEAL